MSDRDPNAPDINNLRSLRPFVRSAARGIAQNTIGGKGAKVSLPSRPTRLCNICGAGFDFSRHANDIELKHDAPCEKCAEALKEGFTAFVSDNRFCFGKSARLTDLAGKVQQVNTETMNALESRFKIELKFPHPNGNGKDATSE